MEDYIEYEAFRPGEYDNHIPGKSLFIAKLVLTSLGTIALAIGSVYVIRKIIFKK